MQKLHELAQKYKPQKIVVISQHFKKPLKAILEGAGHDTFELLILSANHLDSWHFTDYDFKLLPVKNTCNILSLRAEEHMDFAYIHADDEKHAYHNCVMAIEAVKIGGHLAVELENVNVKHGVKQFCKDYQLEAEWADEVAVIQNDGIWLPFVECHFMNHDIPMKKWIQKHITHEMAVLDVGANQGEYTRIFQLLAHKVIAFEPSPLDCEWLTQFDVTVEQMALGNQIGTVPFCHFNEIEFFGYDSLRAPTTFNKDHKVIQVEMNTLDNYLEKNPLKRIDHVKVDIEGGEMDFFRGATKLWDYRPTIQVEISDARTADFDYKAYEIVQLLYFHNYRIFDPNEYDKNLSVLRMEECEFNPEETIVRDCIAIPKEKKRYGFYGPRQGAT